MKNNFTFLAAALEKTFGVIKWLKSEKSKIAIQNPSMGHKNTVEEFHSFLHTAVFFGFAFLTVFSQAKWSQQFLKHYPHASE